MKTEILAPQRPTESPSNAKGPARQGGEAPSDLFALLLSAAGDETESLTTDGLTAPYGSDSAPLASTEDMTTAPDLLATSEAVTPALWPASQETQPPVDAEQTETDLPDLLIGLGLLPQENRPQPKSLPEAVPPHTSPRPSMGPETAGPGQWVSTVAKAKIRTAPPQLLTEMVQAQQMTMGQGIGADSLRSAWHAGNTSQVAGALSEFLGDPDTGDLAALASTVGAEHAGEQREGGQGGHRGEPGRVILESAGALRPSTEPGSVRSFASAMGEAMGSGMDDAFQQLGTQVSLWAAGNTRKASLRLEAGLNKALEVDVSLNGDKAHLAFRTDDPVAREAIRAQAYEILNEMLSRSGLGLEGLSVDAREQGQPNGSGHKEGRPTQNAQSAEDAVAEAPRKLGHIRGAGLSVYA